MTLYHMHVNINSVYICTYVKFSFIVANDNKNFYNKFPDRGVVKPLKSRYLFKTNLDQGEQLNGRTCCS